MLPPYFGHSGLDREANAKDEAVPRPGHARGAISVGTLTSDTPESSVLHGLCSALGLLLLLNALH